MNTLMKGRICLVTGASSGIGRATAKGLADMGAQVVMVARNQHKAEQAQAEIKAETGNSEVDLLLADLSSQASVRKLAQEFNAKYPRLDVLINNAGGIQSQRIMTADGVETSLATNYLAAFLLTNLLVDKLKASAPSRVVNVVTRLFNGTKIDFDNMQSEQKFSGFGAYIRAKLCATMFTFEMARRLEGSGVTVNCVHPGIVRSNFGLDTMSAFVKLINKPFRIFNATPEQASRRILYLATAAELEGVTGKAFADKKPLKTPAQAQDINVVQRLWDESIKLTGLTRA